MNWKLVVFDLAGTTVKDDNSVISCLDQALRAAGHVIPFQELNSRMGIPKPVAIREVLAPESREEAEAIHADFQERMVSFYRDTDGIHEIEGTSATFRWLKDHEIKVAVDTGFDRRTTNQLLQRMPWSGILDASITSDEVEHGRPSPDMIHSLMEKLGINDSAQVVKVGDTPSDLLEGTAANCGMVVGVCEGTHTREQLQSFPHTHLITSVANLPSIL